MYDKLKHYFLLPFNARTLFMHFQWPVVYCFIVDENIHCIINIGGMYVCKKSNMYKQSINNDDKNNDDDDDDDDHNILLFVGLKLSLKYIVIVPTVYSCIQCSVTEATYMLC